MQLRELFEVATPIWSRSGSKTVRKYRCTSGIRKGRIDAKAATCNAPRNVGASISLKNTKRKKGSKMKIATALTKRSNSASRRLKRLNTRPKKRFSGHRRKKI